MAAPNPKAPITEVLVSLLSKFEGGEKLMFGFEKTKLERGVVCDSQTAGRRVRRSTSVVAVGLLAATLGACSSNYDPLAVPYEPINAAERFPISVSKNKVSMEVPIHRRMSRLPGDVRLDVQKFLTQYRSSGNGNLTVVRPKRSRHRTAMATATAELQKLITQAGIDHRSVVYRSYPSGAAGTTAPILLSFQTHVAIGPECGDWSKNLAITYDNVPHPNFGCAGQRNLAAMISNPRDLVTPRTMTPSHAGRRDIVLQQYRTGAGTEADTSASEEGGVSEVGQ